MPAAGIAVELVALRLAVVAALAEQPSRRTGVVVRLERLVAGAAVRTGGIGAGLLEQRPAELGLLGA